MRLIDADALIEEIAKTQDLRTLSTKTIGEAIDRVPSAEPVHKTGKWIDDNGNRTQQYRNNFKCSECGHYQHTPVAKRVDEFEQENKFCHWCGSLMRGDTNG